MNKHELPYINRLIISILRVDVRFALRDNRL